MIHKDWAPISGVHPRAVRMMEEYLDAAGHRLIKGVSAHLVLIHLRSLDDSASEASSFHPPPSALYRGTDQMQIPFSLFQSIIFIVPFIIVNMETLAATPLTAALAAAAATPAGAA